ncbi:hypothetical protein GY15_21180 [Delftia sp. 670]|nr:hypothetical protein GY15_21180 [Delftia sp. 670]
MERRTALGRLGRDAVAAHQAVVGFPVLAEARIVLGVADLHVLAQHQAQAGLGDAGLDHGGAADQDGLGQAVIDGDLGGAQHALVLAFGIGHALLVGLGSGEHRTHEHAGLVDEAGQALAVGVVVGDGAGGDAGLFGSLGHGRRDAQDQAGVEGRGDQVVGAELQLLALVGSGDFIADVLLGQCGDFAHAGQLHGFGDLGGAAVQRATEDVGEAQDVVDLVGVVRTARGHDAVRAHGLGQLGADLGFGVGQGQDDGLVGHGLDHVGSEHAGSRAAQEDVCILDGIGQGAGVRLLRVLGLGGVQATGAAFVDHALGVAHEDVFALDAQAHHHVHAGDGGGAGTGDGDLDVADLLVHQLQPVEQGGAGDDGRAVLVVMEHGDVHALGQLLLDVEALGRLDVLEVDAAQRGFERGDDLDQLVRIALGQFDVEHVDAGELLEQAALAFHHRLAGQRADVTQAQHGRAVGDDADQVAARRVFGGQRGVGLDVQAGVGHAGRIGQRQVALVGQGLGGRDGDLALVGAAMVFAGCVAQGLFGVGQVLGHTGILCKCSRSLPDSYSL